MMRPRIWALVSNGVRARVLRGLEGTHAEDPLELVSKARSEHLLAALSDRSGDGPPAGLRTADPVRRDMLEFAREMLDMLERHRRAGDFDRLAILAEPRMLAILRQELPATLHKVLILERAAGLIHLSEPELRDAVRRMLRAGSAM
jgi:protein required for attachment to host cells